MVEPGLRPGRLGRASAARVSCGCPEEPGRRPGSTFEFCVANCPGRFLVVGEMIKAKRVKQLPEHINAALAKKKGPVSKFIAHNYRHFNAAALLDTAKGYEAHLQAGGKMLVTLAGAMSTAELGITLAEMIRKDKVHAIVCTGANLEEDIFNLVAHDYYERVPHYRHLTAQDEQDLVDRHMNRVTDTCIPEGEAMRRIEAAVAEE